MLAGVHGDEYEPVLAVLDLLTILSAGLIVSMVTLVPIVNVTVMRRDNRLGSDNLDLARICLGRKDGSATERNAFEVQQALFRIITSDSNFRSLFMRCIQML